MNRKQFVDFTVVVVAGRRRHDRTGNETKGVNVSHPVSHVSVDTVGSEMLQGLCIGA